MFAKQETCTRISMKLTCYCTLCLQHWKAVCGVSRREDGSFSSMWPVWRHLVLNRCKGSQGQQTAGWAVKRNVNFIHHLCLRVFLCVDEHISSTHACFHVCLLLNLAAVSVNRGVESVGAGWPCQLLSSPLTRRLLGSLGTQTAAVIPSHNRPAKPLDQWGGSLIRWEQDESGP